MGNTNRCKKFKKAVQKGRNQEQLTPNNISALNSSPASRTIKSSEKRLKSSFFGTFLLFSEFVKINLAAVDFDTFGVYN